MPRYEHFQPEDFLMDDRFIEWMLHPSQETASYWEDFKRNNPLQVETLEKAIHLYKALGQNNDYLTASEASFLKAQILATTGESRNGHGTRRRFFGPWMAAAAAVLLMLVSGVFIYQVAFARDVRVETAYGVRQQVVLPDDSKVDLNGNSSLRYSRDMETNDVREVWLDGEAFFEVTKSATRKFIVHTGNLHIEVLGTSFNVDNRESVTRVVLNTGSITVYLDPQADDEKLRLKPGEMIEYKASDQTLVKQAVDPARFTSWKDDAFDFERIAVREIAEILEARFGYDITITSPALGDKFFTGRFPAGDVAILMAAMEKALSMEVVYAGEKAMQWKPK